MEYQRLLTFQVELWLKDIVILAVKSTITINRSVSIVMVSFL